MTPDNIDKETLDVIKTKHNLCSCSDVDLLKQLVKEQQTDVSKPKRYRNAILSSEYKVDPDALAVYESGKIDNHFDTSASNKPVDDRYILKDPFAGKPASASNEDKNKLVKWVDDMFM
jgi:hypothetical protein